MCFERFYLASKLIFSKKIVFHFATFSIIKNKTEVECETTNDGRTSADEEQIFVKEVPHPTNENESQLFAMRYIKVLNSWLKEVPDCKFGAPGRVPVGVSADIESPIRDDTSVIEEGT